MDLIKASAIKKRIKDKGFRVSKDSFPQFERMLALVIDRAVNSATADKRKTIQAQDVA